jgi:hypothetical protein
VEVVGVAKNIGDVMPALSSKTGEIRFFPD